MEQWKEQRLEQLSTLLQENERRRAISLLKSMHHADVAQLMELMSVELKILSFSLLDPSTAAEVIVELSDYSRDQILDAIHTERLAEIVDDMPSDEATDLIADLPEDTADAILKAIGDQDRREVNTLLQYDEDTAGGIMQLELVKARQDQTVSQVIDAIRQKREEVENLTNVYVVDEANRLLGLLPLAKLVLARPDDLAGSLMEPVKLAVQPNEDQERVAHRFRRYDVMTVPVVDDHGRLLGRITGDDVMEVLEEEASEDFARMAGSLEQDMIYSGNVFRISRMRLPWLLTNLLGGLVSGWLLWLFRIKLTDAIFLISFIPVIMAMGGNVGVQSTTIMVRGIAVGRVTLNNLWPMLFKEIKVALVMGTACGGVAGLVAHFWHHNPFLGLVVGCSMAGAILCAALLGTLAPAAFFKFKVDPAVSAGPFVTTANDILAVAIYFSIATLFYSHLVQ
jgi:magnesium transporter